MSTSIRSWKARDASRSLKCSGSAFSVIGRLKSSLPPPRQRRYQQRKAPCHNMVTTMLQPCQNMVKKKRRKKEKNPPAPPLKGKKQEKKYETIIIKLTFRARVRVRLLLGSRPSNSLPPTAVPATTDSPPNKSICSAIAEVSDWVDLPP